jgi:hypothetical protein
MKTEEQQVEEQPTAEPEAIEQPEEQPTAEPGRVPALADNGELRVNARQFVRGAGLRPERHGGFLHWATQKYGAGHRLTMTEWKQVLVEYWDSPVVG